MNRKFIALITFAVALLYIKKIEAQGLIDPWASLASGANPTDLITDAAGNVYIANRGNNTISKVTSSGILTQVWATLANGSSPSDITIDGSGNIYTANSGNNTISKITSSGVVTDPWVTLASGTGQYTIVIDATGNIYTANTESHTVTKIASNGVVTDPWATLENNTLPRKLAVDALGNVYTANQTNTVSKIAPDGTVTHAWATGASSAIAVDVDGNVYSVGNNILRKITSAGIVTWTATLSGNIPSDLAIDGSGNIYVSQYFSYNIDKVTSDGSVTQGWVTLSSYNPLGIQIDPFKNIYIVSPTSNTLSKILVSSATNNFRSKTTGNWSNMLSWESTQDNTFWFKATLIPNNSASSISILAGHTLTLDSSISISSTNINVTGSLVVKPNIILTVPSGKTLTTNGNLTLLSDETGTASIGNSAGVITGTATVKRYIPGGSRRYRFLGHPFNAAMNITELTDDIDITGTISGSNANLFTTTGSNNPSAFSFNEANGDGALNDAGWTAFTSGNSVSTIPQGRGIRILVRGSKGQVGSLTGGVYTPAAVTIGMTGTLKQGNFTQTLNYTSISKGWNLISNPYASNIDWTTVTKTRIDNAVYTYRPALSGGTYASYVNGSITNGGSQYIETGSAFFVRANAASPSLAWHEADKVSTNPINSTFRTTAIHNRISLTLINTGNQNTDEVVVRFGDDNATDGFDAKYDALNLAGASHDLYVLDNQQKNYSIYHGSELSSWQRENRVVALGFASALVGNYIFKATVLNEFANGNKVWLKDVYTGTLTEINDSTSYTFQVTTDAASQGNSRFSIVFNPKEKIVTSIKELSIKLSPNPAKGLVQLTFSQVSEFKTTINFISSEGKKVKSIRLGKVQYGIETIDISKLSKGVYYVQFENGIETKTEKLIIQ